MTTSRRAFVGAAALGGAVSGKTVTVGAGRHSAVTKWPRYGEAEKKALLDILDNNRFYQEIPILEKETCERFGAAYAKAHCNGTSALMSMFFAVDLPAGSEVLVPSYTASASIAPMRFFGLVPIFVDINPATATFDPEHAAKVITPRTRALVPMHSWGMPCEMDEIAAFAKQHGLLVLEDAAQAQGATFQGKPVGTWGEIGVFSFQTSKVLPAIEGGIALYKSREHYERATAFGNYDLPASFPQDSKYKKYHDTGFGPKFRIHPLAAAIARKQLAALDQQNELVYSQTLRLNQRITQLPGLGEQRRRKDARRVHWASNILFFDEKKAGFSKDTILKELQSEGVRVSAAPYPEQHKFALYREAEWWHHAPVVPDALPGCEQVNRTAIRLPLFQAEADDLIEQYGAAFEKVWGKLRVRGGGTSSELDAARPA